MSDQIPQTTEQHQIEALKQAVRSQFDEISQYKMANANLREELEASYKDVINRDAEINKLRLSQNLPNLTQLSKIVHKANAKWWQDIDTGVPLSRNKGELLALIHSEVSEALEGERKSLMDDKLPQYRMAPVEIIDTIIRCLDYLAGFHPDVDVQEVFDAKMAFNATREDHTHEARRIAGGKQF